MSIITAQFTAEQVKNLNEFQKNGKFHPFTCGGKTDTCKRHSAYNLRREKEAEFKQHDVSWLREEVRKIDNDVYKADTCLDWQLVNILVSQDIPYSDENEGILIATTDGWVCPCGEYKQDWAHDFMSKNDSVKIEITTEAPKEK
jgi:DNA polymerase III delta prime subunit